MKKLLCVFVALMTLCIAQGQQPAFLGISVGTSADEFINQLEQQGFAVRASEKKINEEADRTDSVSLIDIENASEGASKGGSSVISPVIHSTVHFSVNLSISKANIYMF